MIWVIAGDYREAEPARPALAVRGPASYRRARSCGGLAVYKDSESFWRGVQRRTFLKKSSPLRKPLLSRCCGFYFLNAYGADFVFWYFAYWVESRVGQNIGVGLHEVEAHEDHAGFYEICQ